MKFLARIRSTWPVLLAYAALAIWGGGSFLASITLVLAEKGLGAFNGNIVIAVLGILVATALGHVFGNGLGLLHLRLPIVAGMFMVGFVGATFSAALLGPLVLYLLVFGVAALSGYMGVAARVDVLAAWFPMSLSIGAAVIWMNAHNKVTTFQSGSKYAIWDFFSLLVLAGAVFFFMIFLATRHALALSTWQGTAAKEGDKRETARPGRGSLVVLMGFTGVVLLSTALISPYLFRTKDSDKSGEGSSTGGKAKKGKEKSPGESSPGKGEGGGRGSKGGSGQGEGNSEGESDGEPLPKPDTEEAAKNGAQAMMDGLQILAWLLAVSLLLLLLAALLVQPIRRAILLRHLENPLWSVAPTGRVINLWRRLVVALADAGVECQPGEAPKQFAARATQELRTRHGLALPDLSSAGDMMERVHYAGRGLLGNEEQELRALLREVLHALRNHLGVGRRIASGWKRLPDVVG